MSNNRSIALSARVPITLPEIAWSHKSRAAVDYTPIGVEPLDLPEGHDQ